MTCFEELDCMLDKAAANQVDWLLDLQNIRTAIDAAYNRGELADHEWRVLVARTRRISEGKVQ